MSQKERISSIPTSAIDSLEIHEFIYHIMIKGTSLPEYLDDVELSTTQKIFFKEKVTECAKGTQYIFKDNNESDTATLCSGIIVSPSNDFVANSKKLAEKFLITHPNTASSGILIVTRVTMVINTVTQSFIAILKVDYTKVLQQIRDKTNVKKVTFKEIADSLSEDKNSIQKRALIDTGDTFDWDILAVEKGREGQKLDTDLAITDYFEKFLTVQLKQTDSVYSRCVPSHVKKWANMEEDIDAIDARAKVVSYMQAMDSQIISMDDIRTLVCVSDHEEKYEAHKRSFDSYMSKEEVQLNGVEFIVRANSIGKKSQTTKLETNTNVTICFEGTKEERQIEIENLDSGEVKITIIADNVNDITKDVT